MSEPLDPVPLSALQHYSYCPRQCALIHQEQCFEENVYTLRGQRVHEQVDQPDTRCEAGVRVEQALPLFCDRLGLSGKADIVEFLPDGTPRPVEYKLGHRKAKEHDDIQVAAQALCLEEMTGRPVALGVVFHHNSKRRREVPVTPQLRAQVESLAEAVRGLMQGGKLPPPADNPELCRACSLVEICQPEMVGARRKLDELARGLFDVEGE